MLVLVDVDGTLVDEDGEIPDAVLEANDTLRELGARVSLATGRPAQGVAGEMAARLDASAPHVFLNGALVQTGRGRTVDAVELPAESLQLQIDAARDLGAALELYTAAGHYVQERHEASVEHAELLDLDMRVDDLEEVAESERILKTQWIVDEEAVAEIRALDLPDAHLEVGVSPLMPGWRFVHILPSDAEKGRAAETVASHLGDDLDAAVAVGDAPNDRALLEAVGHPFAMANAPAELRADFSVAGAVEEGGVLEVFEYAAQLLYRRG